ncbi:hypothetical protein DPMN_000545 [Dreissena polymorpha]|uniref:Uncharacterized protein n=1 Tax=Dreissena polymorpha TaxID=45954 RepID=A0A9D4MI73_DREPO|nr:hypothetical protein DPMN_000545 [Dreissena polymorpha]
MYTFVFILLYGCETCWVLPQQVQTLRVSDSLHHTVRLRDLPDASRGHRTQDTDL